MDNHLSPEQARATWAELQTYLVCAHVSAQLLTEDRAEAWRLLESQLVQLAGDDDVILSADARSHRPECGWRPAPEAPACTLASGHQGAHALGGWGHQAAPLRTITYRGTDGTHTHDEGTGLEVTHRHPAGASDHGPHGVHGLLFGPQP